MNCWGMLAPRGVPQPVVAILHGKLVRAHALPDLKEKYANLGVEAMSSTPEQFSIYITAEAARFAKVLTTATKLN